MSISFILIPKCSYCGKANCITHKKYVDRCEDCGKRYHRYMSYKSQQKVKYNWKREAKLEEIRGEYAELRERGYKVPREFEK